MNQAMNGKSREAYETRCVLDICEIQDKIHRYELFFLALMPACLPQQCPRPRRWHFFSLDGIKVKTSSNSLKAQSSF
jgi:hypothetical protein